MQQHMPVAYIQNPRSNPDTMHNTHNHTIQFNIPHMLGISTLKSTNNTITYRFSRPFRSEHLQIHTIQTGITDTHPTYVHMHIWNRANTLGMQAISSGGLHYKHSQWSCSMAEHKVTNIFKTSDVHNNFQNIHDHKAISWWILPGARLEKKKTS